MSSLWLDESNAAPLPADVVVYLCEALLEQPSSSLWLHACSLVPKLGASKLLFVMLGEPSPGSLGFNVAFSDHYCRCQ